VKSDYVAIICDLEHLNSQQTICTRICDAASFEFNTWIIILRSCFHFEAFAEFRESLSRVREGDRGRRKRFPRAWKGNGFRVSDYRVLFLRSGNRRFVYLYPCPSSRTVHCAELLCWIEVTSILEKIPSENFWNVSISQVMEDLFYLRHYSKKILENANFSRPNWPMSC